MLNQENSIMRNMNIKLFEDSKFYKRDERGIFQKESVHN